MLELGFLLAKPEFRRLRREVEAGRLRDDVCDQQPGADAAGGFGGDEEARRLPSLPSTPTR